MRRVFRLPSIPMAACAAVPLLVLMGSGAAFADGAGKVDTGDTAWVLASAALVMLMTPGLGLFYAGMVRRKNVLATIMQSFMMVSIVGVLWVVVGYSLAFGKDHWHIIGSLDWVFFRGVGAAPNPDYAPTIPHQAFAVFQLMFAIITPALITGAFAERIRFKAFLIFMVLWTLIVYDPIAHWVWAPGGWLRQMGVLDFAGGLVVHVSSGIAALCCAIVLGRRRGYGTEEMMPHNLTMTLIGTGLLWFGWFGFNAGSALAANGVAVGAFLATNTSGAAAAATWMFIEWWHRGKPTALGAASGAIAGLAAVTPASGYVGPVAAMVIGVVVSGLCYLAIMMKGKLRYDDSLDVFGVHGVGGTWGVVATGLFAATAVNAAGANGLINGGMKFFCTELIGIVAVGGYSFVMTYVLLKLTGILTPLRVEKGDEDSGLDLSQHGETGYGF